MVQNILINELGLSSTLFVGDIVEVRPRGRVLAVQREISSYLGNEGNFNDYPLFSNPIPQPIVYEKVTLNIKNSNPFIKVQDIEVLGIAASSLLQVGSNRTIDAESRIKNIRQLLAHQ
jgi:spore germination protein PE